MEKVLDLKMPGVQVLGKEELREVEGGTPFHIIAGAIAAVGVAALAWKELCDEVNSLGQEIGKALAQ